MDASQTVISIPNDSLFTMNDGRNFMVSLPVETGQSGEIINLPFLFTTDPTTGNVTLETPDTSAGNNLTDSNNQNLIFKNIDTSKSGFFLDASQLALLSGSGEHLVFTTTTTGEEEEITETQDTGQQVPQLIFTGHDTEPSDAEGTHTTYITNVMIPEEPPPAVDPDLFKSDASMISLRKPGRPRKIVDDIHPPLGKGPFRCDICYREFPRWPQFKKHKLEHKDDKPFRCSVCSWSFNLESNLMVHRSLHGKGPPWVCLICSRSFMRLASLKAHLLVHEKEENLFCEQCGEECISQSQLTRHLNEEHKTQDPVVIHPCRYCGQNFSSKQQLRSHTLEHAKRMASLKVSQTRKHGQKHKQSNMCRVCERGFSKPSQLKRHLRIHSGEKPYKCDECGYCFTQKGSLQIHMLKHRGTKPYRCDFCPSTFTQRGNLRSHISRVHIIARPGQQVHQCQQCACVFRKVGSLNAHVSRMHSNSQRVKAVEVILPDIVELPRDTGEVQLDTLDPSDILQQAINKSGLQNPGCKYEDQITEVQLADSQTDGTTKHYLVRMRRSNNIRWHQCVYCSKEFKKPSDLIRHMRTHTNEKPFKCEICRRSFAVKSTLTAHLQTHTQHRAYICNICNKRYSSASSLAVHTRLHQGLKPFSCDDCGRKFRTAGNRSAHQCVAIRRERMQRRRQLVEERREIREQIRGSTTFLQDPLIMTETGVLVVSKKKDIATVRMDDGTSNRPFICAECGCRFKKCSHLKQHEMSHKGIKPFICEICKKGFGSVGVLRAHLQTHTNLRPFKCDECGQLYTTKGSLKRHLVSHSSKKPYICPYCHRDFKASANCRKHIKIHAKEVLSGIMQPESINDMMKHIEPMLNMTLEEHNNEDREEQSMEDLKASEHITHETSVTADGSTTITTTVTIPDNLGPLTQESIRKLEENINQQILASTNSTELISETNPTTSSLADLQPNSSQLAISFPEQGILALGGQNELSISKSGVEFPSLLSEHAPGTSNTGLVTVCGSVEGVYIQGFDGHALDTTLFSGGIPIQTDPIEMGTLSNILASSSQTEPQTEDEPRFSCETCKRVFLSVDELRCHTSEEHCHTCTVCKQKYDSEALLQHHMASHAKPKVSKKKSECKICKHKFEDSREALEHKRRNHQKRRPTESILPVPGVGNTDPERGKSAARRRNSKAVLVSEEELNKALLSDTNASTLSERVFLASVQERERMTEINKPSQASHEPMHANVCTLCPKSFKKPSDLARHFRTHTGERPFVCSECNKSFTVKSTLVAHFQTHRKELASGIPCHLCGSHFATKGSLRVHMRIHTGVKPLKCPHCAQSFRTSGHRKAHIQSAHRENPPSSEIIPDKNKLEEEEEEPADLVPEPPQIESEVEETDTEAPRMESESNENLSGENLQLLPIQLETTELIQLDENLLQQLQAGNFILHDNEGTIRFEVFSDVTGQQMIGEISSDGTVNNLEKNSSKTCDTCGKSFIKPSQLLRHIRIHTGDKPFPCMLCPKRFNQKNALNTHLLMHSGAKPHRCEHCGKFFSQAGNLRTHIKRTHPEVNLSDEVKG